MITVIVLVTGGILITKAQVSVTDLVTFLLYISIMTDPVRTMIDFAEMFQNGYSGYERFQEILAIEPDIQDSQGSEELTDVKGTIDFENVSFQYEENTEKVLSHIDLHVDAGEYLALVGSSGAGKTTLCNLIPRFYDVTGGSIKVDGKDVRDLTLKSLRDHIGIVQQDVYLFVGTVYDNIAYGRPDATREEVIEAAKNANAHEFIMALPDGYDTDIGQRGVGNLLLRLVLIGILFYIIIVIINTLGNGYAVHRNGAFFIARRKRQCRRKNCYKQNYSFFQSPNLR